MGLLRFRFFGADVYIRPGFWFVVFALAITSERSPLGQVILAATLLGTILVHELGHAMAARIAGLKPIVLIHAFGGVTTFGPNVVVSRSLAIRIALAGPAAGLCLALVGLIALKAGPAIAHHAWSAPAKSRLLELIQINGFWSIINLLPVIPFDGGQVLSLLLGPTRQALSATLSLVSGCILAYVLYRLELSVAALVFVAASIMQFVAARRRLGASADENPQVDRQSEVLLEQARRALGEGDNELASTLARGVVETTKRQQTLRHAAEIYAWAAIGKGQLGEARQALVWLSDTAIDPLLQAALLEADGDAERAVHCLRQARTVGDDRPQVAASLVRLLLGAERYGEAALTTIQIIDDVSADEARQVVEACTAGGRPVPAAELATALFAKTGSVSDLLSAVGSYVAADNLAAAGQTLAKALESRVSAENVRACPKWNDLEQRPELAAILAKVQPKSDDAPIAPL